MSAHVLNPDFFLSFGKKIGCFVRGLGSLLEALKKCEKMVNQKGKRECNWGKWLMLGVCI